MVKEFHSPGLKIPKINKGDNYLFQVTSTNDQRKELGGLREANPEQEKSEQLENSQPVQNRLHIQRKSIVKKTRYELGVKVIENNDFPKRSNRFLSDEISNNIIGECEEMESSSDSDEDRHEQSHLGDLRSLTKNSKKSWEDAEGSSQTPNIQEFLKSKVGYAGNSLEKPLKKLICFARAILESPKLLLTYEESLEWTSSVEPYEYLDILRKETPNTAVLSITKSNRKLLNYDKIILLDGGMVIDFGDPTELIQNKASNLHAYLKETDFDTYSHLLEELKKVNDRNRANNLKKSESDWDLAVDSLKNERDKETKIIGNGLDIEIPAKRITLNLR